jgi:putative endonuclease
MERLFSSVIMSFIVYILQSLVTHRFYVGQTYDLEKRLADHNSDLAGDTKNDQPWQVIWSQQVQTRMEAMALEKKIKKRGAKRFLEDLSR